MWILVTLGVTYELYGEYQRAVECHERVLTITEEHGESVYRSYSLWALGVAMVRLGDTSKAKQLLEQALQLTRVADEPLAAAVCLEALAWTAGAENHMHRAAVLMGAAEALGRAVGSSSILFHHLHIDHDQCEKTTRHTLGDDEFETARKEGKKLDLGGAVAYALGE